MLRTYIPVMASNMFHVVPVALIPMGVQCSIGMHTSVLVR